MALEAVADEFGGFGTDGTATEGECLQVGEMLCELGDVRDDELTDIGVDIADVDGAEVLGRGGESQGGE